jgi:hypothetical protein
MEETVHSRDRGIEDVCGLGGGEPQDVAEQEDRPLRAGKSWTAVRKARFTLSARS